MKKLIKMVWVAVAVVVLAACNGKNEAEMSKLQQQIDSLQRIADMKDGSLSDMDAFVDELSAGLDTIAMQENLLISKTKEGTKGNREQMLQNVKAFAKTLRDQRDRINKLSSDLKAKGIKMDKLEGLVNFLNKQLDEKEMMIADLRADLEKKDVDIAQLSERVIGLKQDNTQLAETVSEQGQQIASQDAQLNTGFVVVGTSKALRESGVTQGGFLKKTKVNYNELPHDVFTKIDIRSFNELPIPAGKVKVLSAMPASSYEIVKVNNTNSTLRILNREAFWSASRYLVIQTN
ncbi:MAG: hypothetical protein K5893_07650 [Prevotella sp.]|nr:hypothetical protein [Prevotella sp.]